MPLYNHCAYVQAAIDSILAQSFGNFELIICNDGSTDSSLDVVLGFRDERIKVINKPNGGTVSALNSCLISSHAKMICWLSSDDIFSIDKLKSHYRHHSSRPDSLISIAPYGYLRGNTLESDQQVRPSDFGRLAQFSEGCYINGLSVCSHRQLFTHYGLFDSRYRYAHDAERWFKFFRWQRPFYLDGPPQSYTRVGTGTTPDAGLLGLLDMVRFLCFEINSHGLECLIPEHDFERPSTSQIVQEFLGKVLNENGLFYRFHLKDFIIDAVASWLLKNDFREDIIDFVRMEKSQNNEVLSDCLVRGVEDAHSIAIGMSVGRKSNFLEHLIGLRNMVTVPAQRDIIDTYLRKGL